MKGAIRWHRRAPPGAPAPGPPMRWKIVKGLPQVRGTFLSDALARQTPDLSTQVSGPRYRQ